MAVGRLKGFAGDITATPLQQPDGSITVSYTGESGEPLGIEQRLSLVLLEEVHIHVGEDGRRSIPLKPEPALAVRVLAELMPQLRGHDDGAILPRIPNRKGGNPPGRLSPEGVEFVERFRAPLLEALETLGHAGVQAVSLGRLDPESGDRLSEIAFRTPEGYLPVVVSHLRTPAVRLDTTMGGRAMLDHVGIQHDWVAPDLTRDWIFMFGDRRQDAEPASPAPGM